MPMPDANTITNVVGDCVYQDYGSSLVREMRKQAARKDTVDCFSPLKVTELKDTALEKRMSELERKLDLILVHLGVPTPGEIVVVKERKAA